MIEISKGHDGRGLRNKSNGGYPTGSLQEKIDHTVVINGIVFVYLVFIGKPWMCTHNAVTWEVLVLKF